MSATKKPTRLDGTELYSGLPGLAIGVIVLFTVIFTGVAALDATHHSGVENASLMAKAGAVEAGKADLASVLQLSVDPPLHAAGGGHDTSSGVPGTGGVIREITAEEKWLQMVPHIKSIREQRWTAFQEATNQMCGWIRKFHSEVSFEEFVAEAQSLRSVFRFFSNSEDEINNLMARFEHEIFSEGLIQQLLDQHAELLHVHLTSIDDAGLVNLAIDCSLDTSSLARPTIDVSSLVVSTDGLADDLRNRVYQIIAQKVVSTGSGLIAGASMGRAARKELAYDEHGNHSRAGEFEAVLWGLAAGVAAEVATTYLMDAEGHVRNTLTAGVDEIYAKLLSAQASWRSSFSSMVTLHDAAFLDSVIEQLGVDRDWALAQLQ